MSLRAAYILPHPPLAIPEVGRGEEKAISDTIESFEKVGRAIARHKPESIIFISPHTAYYKDWILIAGGDVAEGNMSQFRAPRASCRLRYDDCLRSRIIEESIEEDIPAGTIGHSAQALDHGLLVPLYFISKYLPPESYGSVSIGGSGLDRPTLELFGRCIARAIHTTKRRAILIASGDLSHRLKENGPYGYVPEGPEFDRAFCDVVESGDIAGFRKIDPVLSEEAAECGLSGFIMMQGALQEAAELEGASFSSELLSYEGTFGVGYGIATYERE